MCCGWKSSVRSRLPYFACILPRISEAADQYKDSALAFCRCASILSACLQYRTQFVFRITFWPFIFWEVFPEWLGAGDLTWSPTLTSPHTENLHPYQSQLKTMDSKKKGKNQRNIIRKRAKTIYVHPLHGFTLGIRQDSISTRTTDLNTSKSFVCENFFEILIVKLRRELCLLLELDKIPPAA